jgi:hypothetical protein
MNDWSTWLGATGGGGFVLKMVFDYIKARPDAKKIPASNAQVLVDTATKSNAELGADLTEVRGEVRQMRIWLRDWEANAHQHSRWDSKVADRLRALGEAIDDPPPLFPNEAT